MPFYRRLAANRRSYGEGYQIVVVSRFPTDAMEAALTRSEVSVDQVVSAPVDGLDPGTPALFIIDRKGFVEMHFSGELDGRSEEEVFSIIRRHQKVS